MLNLIILNISSNKEQIVIAKNKRKRLVLYVSVL